MNKPHLVQVGVFPAELQPVLDGEFHIHAAESVQADPTLAAMVEGIVTRSNYQVPVELLALLPSLRIIATSGVGYDGIPLEQARARGIAVTNTPGVLDAAVSELGIGLLLALLRRIPESDAYTRSGAWARAPFALTTSLSGKRVGIVGMGRIGRAVARRLEAFEVRIAYSGSHKPDLSYEHIPAVLDLARASDILFLCCKGGPETEHLVNAEVLEALGPQGFLVNLARGSVVDEAALVQALRAGRIRGAALDVYHNEPNPDPALLALTNTVLTPHVGSATQETRRLMLQLTIDNLKAVLSGQPPLTPV